MKYRVESYDAWIVSWKTGVSPRAIKNWRIVRESDDRVIETGIATKKLAEQRARWAK